MIHLSIVFTLTLPQIWPCPLLRALGALFATWLAVWLRPWAWLWLFVTICLVRFCVITDFSECSIFVLFCFETTFRYLGSAVACREL